MNWSYNLKSLRRGVSISKLYEILMKPCLLSLYTDICLTQFEPRSGDCAARAIKTKMCRTVDTLIRENFASPLASLLKVELEVYALIICHGLHSQIL